MLKLPVWGGEQSEEGEMTLQFHTLRLTQTARWLVRLYHFRIGKQLSNRKKGPFRKGSSNLYWDVCSQAIFAKSLEGSHKESVINDKYGLKVNNRNVGLQKASRKSHRPGRVPSSHKYKGRMLAWVPRAKKQDVLRDDTEAKEAKLQLKRPPTLVI